MKIWSDEILDLYIAVDTETEVVPFTQTPDIVTMQAYDGEEGYYIPIHKIERFFEVNSQSVFIFHNLAFDFDVLGKAVNNKFYLDRFLDKDKLRDTMLLYKLWHLATVGFVPPKSSLGFLAKELLNMELDKDEDIRCNFAQFKGTPIEDIPEEFLEYGLDDVRATYRLYIYLSTRIGTLGNKQRLSEQIQIAGSIALNHIYKNGIGFDLKSANKKLEDLNKVLTQLTDQLAMYGWVRGVKGSKDKFASIVKMLGINLPKTESGMTSSKESDLAAYRSNHFIDTYLSFIELEKLSTFIREVNSERLHPRYNSLVNTGRTSCAKPNFQQLPRRGGVRELFIPKDGHTFIITDYSTLELCTLAQITFNMFGSSVMKDKINNGEDLHKYYASILLKKPVEEVTKEERQYAKAANFGFPGGLGIDTFVDFAHTSYGLDLTKEEAKEMKDAWFKAFPEMKLYMALEDYECVTTLTGRVRNACTYCSGKNTPFQGLAADGAKIALYNMDIEDFTIVGFCHDEIISEVPLSETGILREKQERIMIDSMRQVVPDVKISVESLISPHYRK